ncbi:hypothetical protein M9H77_29216 [Catharanthus roseus]|uniref:Uncharacterized protein n=1 Tax=Catharanthus roseus TaxID=4058 RepID=A0ACC0AKB0_CATRO|nr:hypothetical protein M9H77_29216 [Catharanthus roseus]
MEGHPHHHQYSSRLHIDTGGGGVGGGDRLTQWSVQETRDFLMIRGEFDPTFMEIKRRKLLWKIIATEMKEKGYNRSAEQCKCKWKNLINRYKACETMEAQGMRQQRPFYNELQTIFTARTQLMGGGSGASKKKAAVEQHYSDEDINELDSQDEGIVPDITKRKKRKIKGSSSSNPIGASISKVETFKEILEDFKKQLLKAYEDREEERREREIEWRKTIEALGNERLIMDRRWREREEQSKIREEDRAQKTDALITALLNELQREDF